MIYFLTIIGLLVLGIYMYLKKHILLPSNTKHWIAQLDQEPLKEFMPGETGLVKNGDVSICYEVIAPKQASKGYILLINGHGQTMLAYPAHFYEPLIEAGYTVIRMDNRGLGGSSWMKSWTKKDAYTLEDMASDSIAVLDKLHISKVHLIGFSMGGMISQRIAISYPDRVKSLTSMATTGFYYDPALVNTPKPFMLKIVLIQIIFGRNLSTLEAKASLSLAISRLLKGTGYFFDDKWYLDRIHYEVKRRSSLNGKVPDQHSMAIIKSGSRYDELKKLDVPTLVIHGTRDTLILFEHAQKYAPMIPNAKTLFIDGLGHDLPEDHSSKMTNEILNMINNIQ